MRSLKISAATIFALALMAGAAFAGGSACHMGASASACPASSMCPANCTVEATRLPSGGLVVHYVGSTPEAIAYLHAKAEGSADKFCCKMTQKMATNTNCKVDVTKVSNGVIVYVTSQKREVVDQYEKEFAQVTAPVK